MTRAPKNIYQGENKMKRTSFALILASLILITACGSEAGRTDTTPAADSTETVSETSETTAETPDITSADFGGAEVSFLMNQCFQWAEMNDFGTGEMNGDILNDAYYRRNKTVEEALNITINVVENSNDNVKTTLQKSIMAGDGEYSAMIARGYSLCSLATGGYLTDLMSMDTLDLSHSWWDQGANRDLSFGNKLYMTTGDISTTINEDSCVILFSKSLSEKYNIPDIYSIVREGKWTLDKFDELCRIVAGDENGDGVMDENDRYGAIIWDDSMMAVINSSGLKCCEINDDGEIELSLYSERAVDAVSKYLAIAGDTNLCFPYQRYSGKGDIEKLSNDMFMGDRALFFVELLHRALSYRNMENDYGIIPFPKYDESQDAYYTNVGAYPSVFLAVPADIQDPDMIGTVLENLGYQSKEIVRDAYYTRTLVGKATRDDESAEMLDIIFSNRVYDIGWLEEVGGYNEEIMNIFRTGKSDFSSMYAKFETKAQDQIAKLNDEISGASEK